MSVLRESGDLARTPLAALLLAALDEKASGVLTVEHPRGTSRLYLRTGMPVGAQTFVEFRPLGQHLLQRGLIDITALNESLTRMARTGQPQGRILVEMGAIDRPALEGALAEQQAGYVALIAALDAGTYRFDGDVPLPEWTEAIRISPLKAIVDALERPQADQLVAGALAQAGEAVALTPVYRQVADRFGWVAAESGLVRRLEAPAAPAAFLHGTDGVPPQRARAMLAALLLLGLADAPGAEGPDRDTPQGLAADLATVGSTPRPGEAVGPAEEPARPGPRTTPPPARRGDPDEARRRRQRLLARAMQNMGVGPFARAASPGPPPAGPEPAPAEPVGRPEPTQEQARLRSAFQEIAPRAAGPDFFVRLGVAPDASPAAVKQAYLALAKRFHPDRFLHPALSDLAPGVKELFASLNEAYRTLSDERGRADHAARLAAATAGGGPAAGRDPTQAARADFQKGEACLRARDFARARLFLEAAVRGDAARAEYKAALAAAWVDDPAAANLPVARQLLAAAMKDPRCDRAFVVAARMARAAKDEVEAERLYRAACKANPGNPEAVREVRLFEERRRRKGEERAHFRK